MRPKPVLEPISALNAFHNHAVRNEAMILSGTVNRPRRKDVGVTAQLHQPSDEALQMRFGEPRTVPRQSTSAFETSNFSTLLSYKQPPAGRRYYGKKIRAFVTQRNLIIRLLLLARAGDFPYS